MPGCDLGLCQRQQDLADALEEFDLGAGMVRPRQCERAAPPGGQFRQQPGRFGEPVISNHGQAANQFRSRKRCTHCLDDGTVRQVGFTLITARAEDRRTSESFTGQPLLSQPGLADACLAFQGHHPAIVLHLAISQAQGLPLAIPADQRKSRRCSQGDRSGRPAGRVRYDARSELLRLRPVRSPRPAGLD